MSSAIIPHTVKKVTGQDIRSVRDTLAVEEPLEIRIVHAPGGVMQTETISVTMRTPGQDEELATGFLFTEGILRDRGDIDSVGHTDPLQNSVTVTLRSGAAIDTGKLQRHFYTSSSCGVCGKSSIDAIKTVSVFPSGNGPDLRMPASLVTGFPDILRRRQEVFGVTGGLHASALFDEQGQLLLLREDVGRHNALDKLIGAAWKQDLLPLSNKVLLLSGRASFELIQKAAMAGIPFVAAVGAPSSLAVETAQSFGMTLLGFVRDERFNIYCGEERVLAPS